MPAGDVGESRESRSPTGRGRRVERMCTGAGRSGSLRGGDGSREDEVCHIGTVRGGRPILSGGTVSRRWDTKDAYRIIAE